MMRRIHTYRRKIRRPKKLKRFLRFNRVLMRRIAGNDRTQVLNRTLGLPLAAVAGMMNAGGFLILRHYTSHMTGTLSSLADMVVLKEWAVVYKGLGVILFFVMGAIFSTLLVIIGRHYNRRSQYAFPLMLEALLLVIFSFAGFYSYCTEIECILPLMFLLSFIMGMQNALITKISKSEVRTTHVTGTITDIGIGLARWAFSHHPHLHQSVQFNMQRLRFNCLLVMAFLLGGLLGAWGFNTIGFNFCLFPVAILLWASLMPVWADIKQQWDHRGEGNNQ